MTTDGTQRVARTDSLAYSLTTRVPGERAVGVVHLKFGFRSSVKVGVQIPGARPETVGGCRQLSGDLRIPL